MNWTFDTVAGPFKGTTGGMAWLATHPSPDDVPMRVAFGDSNLDSFYLTASDGNLYRPKNSRLRGATRIAMDAA